jgi:hypothetical protein
MAHVIRLINIMEWSNGKNPHLAITGEPYGLDKAIQPFGCMVLVYIPKEKRISKATPVSKLGVYLGKTDDVRDGMDVADLEFDFKEQRWVIGGVSRGVVDAKTYPTVFPLRLLPPPVKKGDITPTLETFLESQCPWFQQGKIPTGVEVKKGKVASGSAVYEVEKIVDRRSTKSGRKYCVKWKNYPDTDNEWLQQSQLLHYGAADMVRKFDEKRDLKAKTKKALMVGVVQTSGNVNPLLQSAEQFLTDHHHATAAATAQWHTEGAGPWIKSVSYTHLTLPTSP